MSNGVCYDAGTVLNPKIYCLAICTASTMRSPALGKFRVLPSVLWAVIGQIFEMSQVLSKHMASIYDQDHLVLSSIRPYINSYVCWAKSSPYRAPHPALTIPALFSNPRVTNVPRIITSKKAPSSLHDATSKEIKKGTYPRTRLDSFLVTRFRYQPTPSFPIY